MPFILIERMELEEVFVKRLFQVSDMLTVRPFEAFGDVFNDNILASLSHFQLFYYTKTRQKSFENMSKLIISNLIFFDKKIIIKTEIQERNM